MLHLRGGLQPGKGPLIQVEIGVSQALESYLLRTGRPVPSPITVTALIDTGADDVVISPRIVSHLGLYPVGAVPVFAASGHVTSCAQYEVGLKLVPGPALQIPVVEMPLCPPLECLIGCYLLSRGTLTYDGMRGVFELVLF
jgi:predicted aspartyl protease